MSPVIHFLPWLQLERSIEIDDIAFDHFTLPRWKEYARSNEELRIAPKLLSNYCSTIGTPVEHCVVIRQNGALFTDLDETEFARRKSFIRLICFAALASRELFRRPTWNSSYFIDYAQRFEGEHNYVTVVSRRREGQQLIAHPIAALRFNRPFQTEQSVAKLDLILIGALDGARVSDPDWWSRIETAIYFFNEANSDREDVPAFREVVDVFTAFECLFDQRRSADRLAYRFADTLSPALELLVSESPRPGLSLRGGADAKKLAVRFQWMRDLATTRDNIAHGRLQARTLWTHQEHLVLAAIAFPLTVKLLLAAHEHYTLTDEDQAQIDAFEHLADADFMRQPEDARNSVDYLWNRLQAKFYRNRRVEERVRAVWAKMRPNDG